MMNVLAQLLTVYVFHSIHQFSVADQFVSCLAFTHSHFHFFSVLFLPFNSVGISSDVCLVFLVFFSKNLFVGRTVLALGIYF